MGKRFKMDTGSKKTGNGKQASEKVSKVISDLGNTTSNHNEILP